MNISVEEVQRVSKLANLDFTDSEINKLLPQFEKIIDYIHTIDQVDLSEYEPLSQIISKENSLREDDPQGSISTKDALKNAPKHNDVFFKVPKVLE